MGQHDHEDDVRYLQRQRGHHAGDDNLSGPDGRDLKTAENILFAILHGAHPHAEQAAAQHTQAQHDGYNLLAIAASAAQASDPKENQREYIAEEQGHAVPQGQQQIHPDLSQVRVQHRLSPSASFR